MNTVVLGACVQEQVGSELVLQGIVGLGFVGGKKEGHLVGKNKG